MLIGLEIGAELVLVQDLGQNLYPNKYRSRPKVNFKHLRYQPMGAINVFWAGNHFPYHLTLLKKRPFGLCGFRTQNRKPMTETQNPLTTESKLRS